MITVFTRFGLSANRTASRERRAKRSLSGGDALNSSEREAVRKIRP